jgi:hypothetical protein
MAKKTINVKGVDIVLYPQDAGDYISLTDIAKQSSDEPRFVIRNWLSTQNTIQYLGAWETLHNPNFNRAGFRTFRDEFFENPFSLTPKKWLELTNASGIESKSGRYGGTFAHSDIAINFCYWINPIFQVYLIKEFQRLKEEESNRLNTDWSVKRLMSKANFHIHSEAVRENLVPHIDWNTKREAIYQASETDLINLALFGQTAREWRIANPKKKGNMRDHASTSQLLVLSNLQSLNAKLIKWDCDKEQRFQILHESAKEELSILINQKAITNIKKLR